MRHGISMAVALTAGVCGTGAALAQAADNVTVDVAECVALESEADRLACFASRVDAALGAADESAPAPPAAPSAPPAPAESLPPAASAPPTPPIASTAPAAPAAPSAPDASDASDGPDAPAPPERPARAAVPDPATPPSEPAAVSPAQPAAVVQSAPASEPPSRRERRAMRRAERAEQDRAGLAAAAAQAEAGDGGDEVTGTIAAMRQRIPNSFVITLEDGQIWEQTMPKRYPLRPGLQVRIYPTSWGDSWRLTGVDLNGHIQVRRIQ